MKDIEQLEDQIFAEQVFKIVSLDWSIREKRIMELLFYEERTLQYISDIIGVSKERIRQIKFAVLRKSRRSLKRKQSLKEALIMKEK